MSGPAVIVDARVDLLAVTGDKALPRDFGMRRRVISPKVFVAGT
jgi:hypothetical protein